MRGRVTHSFLHFFVSKQVQVVQLLGGGKTEPATAVIQYANAAYGHRHNADRIRDLREDRDLKQKQIADYLMCDQSLYSKYERGERDLPLEYAARLADYYGVSVDYLLCRTNIKRPYPKK